ncbi:MAG: hypothetical protein AAB635_02055 [Patescibacteria group bacterium]
MLFSAENATALKSILQIVREKSQNCSKKHGAGCSHDRNLLLLLALNFLQKKSQKTRVMKEPDTLVVAGWTV